MAETPKYSLPVTSAGRPAMDVIIEAARTAGRIIQDGWNADKQITFKGRADIVTDIDVAAEKAVLEILTRRVPGLRHPRRGVPAGGRRLALPLGGGPLGRHPKLCPRRPSFLHHRRLGRGRRNSGRGDLRPGARRDVHRHPGPGSVPERRERIAVSESRELSRCLLSFDLGYVDEKAGLALDMVRSLWPGMYSIRMMGTAGLGLAYAASGRVDLFFHHSLSPWDLATGLLLIREAGGVVVDRQGATAGLFSPSVICSSAPLVEEFLSATDGLPWRTAS